MLFVAVQKEDGSDYPVEASRPFKCFCDPKNGYNNTADHPKKDHESIIYERMEEWMQKKERARELAQRDNASVLAHGFTVEATDKSINIARWIDFIITENLPFSSCSKPSFRRNSNLKPISRNTLM